MTEEIRTRLIRGLPVCNLWDKKTFHDHNLETFIEFTQEKLQLIRNSLSNPSPANTLINPVTMLFEEAPNDSEEENVKGMG
jgi:hypothetical protein